jgi:2-keto-4-pentenoate hydratase/2-oxohepta-3-ene-1,7-dioic acid hydratase in catechol pathway
MKIICIGRNYVDHAKELKNPIPENPVFFMKPQTALLPNNKPFYYPDFSTNIHYELELVIKINRNGKYIPERFAYKYYDEVALGIDFTARDLQAEAKSKGLPWEIAKGFDGAAPISPFVAIDTLNDKENIQFSLLKNGQEVQRGSSKDMIFSFSHIISYLSRFVSLKMGDIIFTGTPAGVGEVHIGDVLEAYLEHQKMINLMIK